jgi:hypothetical protein
MISSRKKRSSLILIILLVVISFLPQTPAAAAPDLQEFDCAVLPVVGWQEVLIGDYAILYPEGYENILGSLNKLFEGGLADQYPIFSRFFKTTLSLPITIRVYPGIESFYCLNVIALQVAPDDTHTRIGIREIALFGDRILNNFAQWEADGLNIFRYELGILFIEQVTNSKAPPGLLAGAGVYMMNPKDIFEQREISAGGIGKPQVTWRSLWESENTLTFPKERYQAVSIVAYLVEAYGWETFLRFLTDLCTSEGYRQSLASMYGIDFSALQQEWENFYPLFYQGRWRAHVLYDFDLSPYQTMIAGGAYTDAALGLRDVITFLEQNDQSVKLTEAQALQEHAKSGQEASALVAQARLALQNKQHALSIQLADQAQAIFNGLGNLSRTEELDNYRATAREVMALQAEMDTLSKAYNTGAGSSDSMDRMIQISQRLAELGESQARASISSLIQEQEAAQARRQNQLYVRLILLILSLLGLRLFMLRLKPRPEVI